MEKLIDVLQFVLACLPFAMMAMARKGGEGCEGPEASQP